MHWVGLPVEPATFRKKLSCCSRENPNSRVPEGVPPSELDQISQRDFTTLSGTCPSNEHYSSLFCSGEMGGHPLSSTPWAPRRGGVILDLLPRWYLASCSAKSWSPASERHTSARRILWLNRFRCFRDRLLADVRRAMSQVRESRVSAVQDCD